LLLAAVFATLALAFVSAARADASTQLINAAQRQNAMEVLADATVSLRPSKPASFRQKWDKSRLARSVSASATWLPTHA
jgi:hypothetical protein